MDRNKLQTSASLQEYSTFGIGAEAQYLYELSETSEIPGIISFTDAHSLPIYLLGEGSNTLFADTEISALLLKNNLSGISSKESGDDLFLTAAAGENWDHVVGFAVSRSWSGIEALSAIPGSVGAAPVQNIGAYGSEIADVLTEVRVYDKQKNRERVLKKTDCNFGYRTSIFKEKPERFIILSATLKLSQGPPEMPNYDSVKTYFKEQGIVNPTAREVRAAITNIRWSKLPRPQETPNLGSFFTNPVVASEHVQKLLEYHSEMPHYDVSGGVKIPAGWLIEKAGLKGIRERSVGTYKENALVLVSERKADVRDLIALISKIKNSVGQRFGILLEREPNLIF